MPTFTPPIAPSISSDFQHTPQVYKATMGDGREQVTSKGINNIDRSATLVFQALTQSELDDIVEFFDDLYGVFSFDYQIPSDSVSRTWREEPGTRKLSPNGGLWSLSIQIREVRL